MIPARILQSGVTRAYIGRSAAASPVHLKSYGVYADLALPKAWPYPDIGVAKGVIMAGAACSNGLGSGLASPLSANIPEDSTPYGRVLGAVTGYINRTKGPEQLPLFGHTSVGVCAETEAFCQEIVAASPPGMGAGAGVSMQLSGTDAVFFAVNACRMAAAVEGDRGMTVMVGSNSYHGSADVAFGNNQLTKSRLDAGPLQVQYPSYHAEPGESEAGAVTRLRRQFDAAVADAGGSKAVACVLLEVIGGSSSIGLAPPDSYLQMLASAARAHGIRVVSDEVMCGLGRRGGRSVWACQEAGFVPDAIAIGKSLGGGIFPVSATVVSEALHTTITGAGKHYQHSHTYVGHPLGAAAARQAFKEFHQLVSSGHVDRASAGLQRGLEPLQKSSQVKVQGRGMMVGVVISPPEGKSWSPKQRTMCGDLLTRETLLAGVSVYRVPSPTGAGLLVVPPLTCSEGEALALGEGITKAVMAALGSEQLA